MAPWVSLSSSLLWVLARAQWLRTRAGADNIRIYLIYPTACPTVLSAETVRSVLRLEELRDNNKTWYDMDHEYLAWRSVPVEAILGSADFGELEARGLSEVMPRLGSHYFKDHLAFLRQDYPAHSSSGNRPYESYQIVNTDAVLIARDLANSFISGDQAWMLVVGIAFLALKPRMWHFEECMKIRWAFLEFDEANIVPFSCFSRLFQVEARSLADTTPEIKEWVRGVRNIRQHILQLQKDTRHWQAIVRNMRYPGGQASPINRTLVNLDGSVEKITKIGQNATADDIAQNSEICTLRSGMISQLIDMNKQIEERESRIAELEKRNENPERQNGDGWWSCDELAPDRSWWSSDELATGSDWW
ncbi:MAG: hypothetical protein M1820_006392 [Bogoriella megaspora]|nr:MAG: hypothetical protein M1820_006392 [Bogoriella megaspora]